MHIRCPHCHNAVEVVGKEDFASVNCPSCGSSFDLLPETASHWLTKRSIAHFELLEQLGTGGFGTVWKARDTQLDRLVAVKIPRRDQFDTDNAEMFRREARAAAQLRHPHIVAVHEVGRDDGTLYIVSDFVQGVTLADRLTAGRLTPREAAELLAQVAAALHHAHESGVIHRDLKPQNIMLDGEGNSHLMDFGLAKREAGEISMTVDGKILGTAAYMSPEQARGEAHRVDRRTDVYSLGVILFELLTGERPFRGNHRMLLHQVMHDEPPSPRKLNSRVPRDLETICLKCLEKDPGRRYATAAEVAAELKRWLSGSPILARPISPVARAWRWTRRNPLVAGLSAAVVIAMLIGTTVSTWFAISASERAVAEANERHRADAEAVRANAQAQEAADNAKEALENAANERRQRDLADSATKRARRHLYAAHMNLAQAAWEDARVGAVLYLLARQRPLPGEEDLRGFEWYYWDRLCHLYLLEFRGHALGIESVAFSPDGQRLASAGSDRTIKLWDAATGRESLALEGHNGTVFSVAFSPDGKRLASASYDRKVKVWDLVTGKLSLELEGHNNGVLSVAFSPDGKRLASAGGTFENRRGVPGEVRVWDAATGQVLHALKGHTDIAYSVAFSPDGKRLASASADETVKVWDVATGEESLRLNRHIAWCTRVSFSPDGKRLAEARADGTIKVWDAVTGQESLTLKGHTDFVRSLAFSSNGKQLASASSDRTIRLWDTATGLASLTLKGHTNFVKCVVFSPDGKRLASASEDNTVKVWGVSADRRDAATGRESLTLKGEHTNQVVNVVYSPDGNRLALASQDRTVKVWDSAKDQVSLMLKGHTGVIQSVAYSPDGQQMASASWDKTVKVWDAANGLESLTLKGHTESVHGVAFSPVGKRLASASWDKTIKVWDAATGEELLTLKGHTALVTSVAFTPDGKRLASASWDQTVKVWDAATGRELLTLTRPRVESGTPLISSSHDLSVAFSPDGNWLASTSGNLSQSNGPGEVNVWDATTGQVSLTLKGHSGWITSVAFSPDGQRLVSASDDKTVKFWDVVTGQELLTLKGHTAWITSVAFTPDGKRLASASWDQSVKVWDATPRDQ